MNRLLRGQTADRPQGGGGQQLLQGLQQSAESIGQAVNQNSPHNGRGVEEDQLGDPAHAGPPHSPEDHVKPHQQNGDKGRSQVAEGKNGSQQRRGRQHLGHHADENAHGAEDASRRLRPGTVLLGNHLKQGGAAAAPEGRGVANGQNQTANPRAQSKPPGGHSKGKRQLCRADGGLAADQGTHNGPADNPGPGLPAAAGKIRSGGHLPAGIYANSNDKPNGGKHSHHVQRT